jgi:hypothetical protein
VVEPDETAAILTQFLGGSVGTITTPPLDAYGEPQALPLTDTTATTAPSSTAQAAPTGRATPIALADTTTATTVAPTSIPSYDPTPC